MKYLGFFMLFLTLGVQAQQIDLTWSEKIKTKKKNISVLGGKEGNYFTGHANNDNYFVCRKYNNKMKMVKEEVVPFELDEKRFMHLRSMFVNNKIVHIISEHKRKEDKKLLLAAFTDMDLKSSGKTLVLDEASDEAMTFGVTLLSPDSTKVLVYHENPGSKKDLGTLSLKVYKSDFMDIILDKLVQIPIKNKFFSTESINVDNLGNVYILAKIIREGKERSKGQSELYYKLIIFDKDTANPSEFDFDFENQEISSIEILPSKNNTLICTGFISDIENGFLSKKVSKVSDEMFTAMIDCNTKKLGAISKVKVEGLYPEKIKKSEEYVPYRIRKIFPKDNGGYVVVAEQYKMEVRTYSTMNGGMRTVIKNYFCDIACLHVDNKGELESITKVPKYQLNAGNPSILTTYVNGNTYIIYEDLTKNLDARNDKETKRSTESMLSSDSKNSLFLLTIAPDGKPKKEILFNYKESDIRPNILESCYIDDNTIILKAENQIGELKFK